MRFNRYVIDGLLLICVIGSSMLFAFRGPMRALEDSGDFATVYAAARSWNSRLDPYVQANIDQQYQSASGDPRHAPNSRTTASVYPPCIFPLVSLIAVFGWGSARALWLAVNLGAFIYGISNLWMAIRPASFRQACMFAIVILSFSPVHTGISKGQPSALCISLLVSAVLLPAQCRGASLRGLLLGLACCLKPNIGLPFLLFYAWHREWIFVRVSCLVLAAFTSVGFMRLQSFSPGWLGHLATNVADSTLPGSSMDPTLVSASSHLLINFQTVVGFFTASQSLCNFITGVLALFVTYWVITNANIKRDESLILAVSSVLILLASYHRYYDCELLLVAAVPLVEVFRSSAKAWQKWSFVVALVPIWLPLQAFAAKSISAPQFQLNRPLIFTVVQFVMFRNQPLCLALLCSLIVTIMPPRRFNPTLN